jgi:hypothetical protein
VCRRSYFCTYDDNNNDDVYDEYEYDDYKNNDDEYDVDDNDDNST